MKAENIISVNNARQFNQLYEKELIIARTEEGTPRDNLAWSILLFGNDYIIYKQEPKNDSSFYPIILTKVRAMDSIAKALDFTKKIGCSKFCIKDHDVYVDDLSYNEVLNRI